MKKNFFSQAKYWSKVAVIGVVLGFALQFARAWTEPSAAPPGGNLGAPINTGANIQSKGDETHNGDICVWQGGVRRCLSSSSGGGGGGVTPPGLYGYGQDFNNACSYPACWNVSYPVQGSDTIGCSCASGYTMVVLSSYSYGSIYNEFHTGCDIGTNSIVSCIKN